MAYKLNFTKQLPKVLALGLVFTLAACSTDKEQTVKLYQGNENQLYTQATEALVNGQYSKADEILLQISLQYPFGNHIQDSQVAAAYASYKTGNYALTTGKIDTYFKASGDRPTYGDYMLLLHALSLYEADRTFTQRLFNLDTADNDVSNIETAIGDLSTIITQYPQSKYRDYAFTLNNYFVNYLARHNLKVAQFYLDNNNPLAASKRATTVIYNFANTKYLEPAIALIVKANKTLGINSQTDVTKIRQDAARLPQVPFVGTFPEYPENFLLPPFLAQAKTTK